MSKSSRCSSLLICAGLFTLPCHGLGASTDDGLTHLQQAWTLAGREQWEEAAKEATAAVALLGTHRSLPEALEVLGLAKIELDQPAEAVEPLRRGLGACERCPERLRLRALLAAAYRDLRQFEDAEAILRKLLAEAEAKASLEDQALGLKSLASVAVAQGRRYEAVPILQDLIRREDEAGRPGADRGQILRAIGALMTGLGEAHQALNYLRQAESLADRANDQPRLLQIRTDIAEAYVDLGQLEPALALFEAAEISSRRSGNDTVLSQTLYGSAQVLRMQGSPEEARENFEEALEVDRRNRNVEGQIRALNQLAEINLQLGRYNRAFSLFEEATALSRSSADVQGEFTSLTRGADIFLKLGQESEASARIKHARELGHDLTAGDWATKAIFAILQLFQDGRLNDALREANLALERALQIDSKQLQGDLLEIRAVLHLHTDRFEEGRRDAMAALSLRHTLGDRNKEAELNLILGFTALRTRRYDEALRFLGEARRYGSEIADSGVLPKTLWALGATYENLKNYEAAIAAYSEAVEIIESRYSEVQADALFAGLAEAAFRSYSRWSHLLAQQGQAEQAFDITERGRARIFLRRMGNPPPLVGSTVDPGLLQEEKTLRSRIESLTRQIQDRRLQVSAQDESLAGLARQLDEDRREYGTLRIRIQQTSPAYASRVLTSPLRASEIQRLLGSEVTLVEYLVDEGATWAFVVDGKAIQLVRLYIEDHELEEQISEFRQRIENKQYINSQAFLLYQRLFKPLAPFIVNRKVVIVPQGPLHALPFGALSPDVGKTWLAEKYALSVLPSSSLLSFLLAERNESAGPMLALGDPEGSLPAAASEARTVASLYGTKALLGTEASIAALRSAPRPIGVLHLATHAVFDPVRPLFSRIRLADAEFTGYDILNLDLQGTRLVVLSGCETAVGPSDVAELEGLNRAFLYAGASAVAATLWKVDDEASGALILAFYRHLRAGAPTAEALRLAQVEILRGPEKWHHPYYWAAFQLTGAPD